MKKEINRGLAWVGTASSLVGALDILAYALILALWIDAADFGVAMLVIAWFPVLDLATDLGLHAAVIQRDDHTPEKISTVFWLNLLVSGILAAVVGFWLGPVMADFYEQPVLHGLLAAYGAKLVWQNTYFMPYALLERELKFRELSVVRLVANVFEFAAKVGFAAAGFGIWCFVLGPLCRVLVTGIGVQLYRPWRPLLVFRYHEALDWFRFGMLSSAHRILYHAYTNVDYLVVGKIFGQTATGLYGLAYKLVLEPAFIIAEVFNRIAFPAFSRLKNDKARLRAQLISFARINLVVTLSLLAVIFVSVEEILLTVWGNEWIEAQTTVRVLCGVGLLRALSFLLPPLLDGIGRPGLSLRYTALAAVLMPTLFVTFAKSFGDSLGYLSVAIAWVVGYPFAFGLLVILALRLLEMPLGDLVGPLWRFPLWATLAGSLGFAAAWLVQEQAPMVRLAAGATSTLVALGVLFARFEGITPQSVRRAFHTSDDS